MTGLEVVAVIAIFLAIYAFGCFVNYCIVRKFDPAVSFGENLIPLYNFFLLLKQAVASPGTYFLIFVGIGLLGVIVDATGGGPRHPHPLAELAKATLGLIDALMMARVWGLIARKLGKSFWLYAILSLIPVANVIIMLILAFGDSRPVTEPGSVSPEPARQPQPPEV